VAPRALCSKVAFGVKILSFHFFHELGTYFPKIIREHRERVQLTARGDREAHVDTLEMLSRFKGKISGIMHCFSGSREMAEQCIKSNFYISFAGPVTFPNSHKLQEIAKWVDLNKILLPP